MSRIDNLIKKHCPKGIVFKELQELFIMKNGYTPSKSNRAFWCEGTVPWFRMDDIRKNGRILSKSLQQITEDAVKGGRLFPANSIIVATSATIGEHALITIPHLSNQRFASLTLKPKYNEMLKVKFLFYYCFILDAWCCNNTTKSSFASVDMNGFKKFRIPVPPLEVQEEIVRILDTFTKLEAELAAELKAELKARQQQYSHYRDELLSFDENVVRYLPMGEVGTFVRGNGMPKSDFVGSGVGCIHYGQIYTHYGICATSTTSFVSPEKAEKLAKVDPGDLIITNTSENLEDVCKSVAWLGSSQIVTGGHATVFKHEQDPKYLSYYFKTPTFFAQKKKWAFGTKVIDVSAKNLAKIRIPVPPLEEQERIVAILDKFDALVNDLSVGLPAEIEARRQQYEHYRNQLLTFKEAR